MYHCASFAANSNTLFSNFKKKNNMRNEPANQSLSFAHVYYK